MTTTKVSDIIVPEVFAPYVIEEITEKSTLIRSGIVVPDSRLDVLAANGGSMISVPFFKNLTGDDEVLSDQNALTPDKITTGQDIARLLMRGKAWGVNDLAKALSGADPMGAIASMVADYWNQREQIILLSVLDGVFGDNAANDDGDLIRNIAFETTAGQTADNLIGPNAVIDAQTLLGDASDRLTAMIMHSVVYARLKKNNLIDFVEDSIAKVQIPTYLGLRVIVDDGCPVIPGTDAITPSYKYTTYLFGQGAVARGEGRPDTPVETDRDSLLGEDLLIHRRHFIMHIRGIAWVEGSLAGLSPTNVELATAIHWNRVYHKKNIKVVKLVTNG